MTITRTLGGATPLSLTYLLTHDGGAGNTFVLTNAIMQADLLATLVGGPLLNLLRTVFNPNSQAIARQRMMAQAVAVGTRLDVRPHCKLRLYARDGTTIWSVDADVDAVLATNFELNILGTAVAGNGILSVEFQHTLVG